MAILGPRDIRKVTKMDREKKDGEEGRQTDRQTDR